MAAEQEFKWYVVRAISGQEKKVKSYIELELDRAKLSKFVPEILIPLEKRYKVKDGKKSVKEANAFPGYILVHANLVGEVAAYYSNAVNGVVGFSRTRWRASSVETLAEVNQNLLAKWMSKQARNQWKVRVLLIHSSSVSLLKSQTVL